MALTPERIRELWENYSPTQGVESFARAVEAAAIESQSREIAALKAQEAELCTLYGLAQAECKRLRAKAERYDYLTLEHGEFCVARPEAAGEVIKAGAADALIDAAIAAKGGV